MSVRVLLVCGGAAFGALSASITTPRRHPGDVHAMAQATVPRDHLLRPVADAPRSIELHTDGKRVLVSTGWLLYEAANDGSLALVGDKASYATMMGDIESVSGFADWMHVPYQVAVGEHGHYLHDWDNQGEGGTPSGRTFRVGGERRKPEPVASPALSHVIEWRGMLVGIEGAASRLWTSKPTPLATPPGWDTRTFGRGKNDSLVVLGYERGALIWKTPESPSTTVPFPPNSVTSSCDLVPSFDDEVYLSCSYRHEEPKLFQLVDDQRWQPLKTPPRTSTSISIARDGSVFIASNTTLEVKHCQRDSDTCEKLAIEADPKIPAMAFYAQSPTEVVERNSARTWIRLEVVGADEARLTDFSQILAPDVENVWLVARSARSGSALFHPGRIRERTRLPDSLTSQVEVRNATPPTSWAGHCDQVFVTLADDASKVDVPAVRAALGREAEYASPFHAFIIDGKLHDARVAGVLFARYSVDTKIEAMEKEIQALIDRYTTNPTNAPRASCTVPVIDRMLDKAPF